MKYLIIADLHLNLSTLDLGIKTLYKSKDIVESNDLDGLVIAGDLHDTKAIIRSECQRELDKFLEDYNYIGKPLYILIGNHCLSHKDADFDDHAFKAFEGKFKNVIFVSRLDFIANDSCALIPYRSVSQFRDIVRAETNSKTTKYIICHQEISGVKMGRVESKCDIPQTDFSNFDRVISGHIHQPQSMCNNKIVYVGSPYQLNFGESGEEKRGIIFDFNNNTYENVYFDYLHYYKIEIDLSDADELLSLVQMQGLVKQDEKYWLVFKGTKERCTTFPVEQIKSNFNNPRITYEYIDSNLKTHDLEKKDFSTICKEYINESNTELNKKELEKIMKKIMEE